MPRLSCAVPKYRKHKNSGQAFVELNGDRHYLVSNNPCSPPQSFPYDAGHLRRRNHQFAEMLMLAGSLETSALRLRATYALNCG